MEFMFGAIFMLIVLLFFGRIMKQTKVTRVLPVVYSQSRTNQINNRYDFVKSIKKITQSSEDFRQNNMLKVITIDGLAYWIEENALYQAEIINRNIIQETKKKVDTHTIDGVELDKIVFIVDRLTKGNDDSSNTGNK
jgi:predicted XRE-type DNA-binding protein